MTIMTRSDPFDDLRAAQGRLLRMSRTPRQRLAQFGSPLGDARATEAWAPAGDAAGEKVHRAERRYGVFRRSINLPSDVQADKIEATTAQDGVLRILMPKAAEPRAKRIQVQPGKAKPAVTGAAVKNGG